MDKPFKQPKRDVTEADLFQSAIPGISLTNDPANPKPFEKAPEFTDVQKAQEHLFESLVDPEKIPTLLEIINMGVPLTSVAQSILFAGFNKGKWNPDLYLLLIEPCIYILLFICEQSGVDYILSPEDNVEIGRAGEQQFLKSITSGKGIARTLGIDPEKAKINLPEEVTRGIGEKIFNETASAPSILGGMA